MLFGRKTQDEGATVTADEATTAHETRGTSAKNRPTPTRREREAAQRRPLVGGTQQVTAEQKAKQREARRQAREGMLAGDEKYLGARDRGPLKRYLRDSVDTRRNIGEILLPLMIVILAMSLINAPWARVGLFVGAYGLILFGVLDTYLLWRRVKRRATEAFGEEPPKGSASYVILRAFQMRGSRVPRPRIKRGEPVRATRR